MLCCRFYTALAGIGGKMPAMPDLLSDLPDTAASALRKRCFAPVVDAHTRVLVLGSLPGDASLAQQQYYGHKQNAFWRLMAQVTGVDLPALAYPARLEALAAAGIGLWDVIAEAERDGSLDTAIRARANNDLSALLASLPALHTIAFNGGTAARLGRKALALHPAAWRLVDLPSSSAAHTMAFASKLAAWLILREAPPSAPATA